MKKFCERKLQRLRTVKKSSCLLLAAIFYTSFALLVYLYLPNHKEIPEVGTNVTVQSVIWKTHSYRFSSCTKPSSSYAVPRDWSRFLVVRSNGGLNQMRAGISDMVAVARIMNATLVIPKMDRQSFWKDSSVFSDIFNQEHFIKSLKEHLHIIKELPKKLEAAPRARKHFTTMAGVGYYEELADLWQNYRIISAAKSDARLANNGLPSDIQKLRCHAFYNALRFAPSIESIGKKLVSRIRSNGPYVSLHLRYEKDMLAFTGCTHGLTIHEASELTMLRESTNHWKTKRINSTDQRRQGYCPLTPKEVGKFLRALGFPQESQIYIAAGEIYGGTKYISELKSMYPNLLFKESLATLDELKPFSGHATQTAAIDYIVSVESDIFIPSFSGNMARAVSGHRRFLGHRKTIIPDRKRLVTFFEKLDKGEMQEGQEFFQAVTSMHKFRQGAPRKRKRYATGNKGHTKSQEESFYENPFPECICKKTYLKSK